ncbi:MAG: AMP-binding protein [Polyangiaceae bacterium]|nr:AMP-binding protein [Polyangiaceae bacterium]
MGAWSRFLRRTATSSKNVLELVRAGRLGQVYGAPYEVIDQGPHHRLRRYATCPDENAPPVVLVPPLMVTSEVYDIEEELSAVAALGRLGVQPFVVDFGAPERETGGMTRTLDDHVLAVVKSIWHVRSTTGRRVHLCGYSQGGMFAYQAAAFLRSEGIASVITFGSPVDIHRSVPAIHSQATAAFLRVVEPALQKGLEQIEGLPGFLTSTGFKMVSPAKEVQQRVEFVRKLHDRGALERREARRRFLGGEGFVAWPGPAFRAFVEQFIVHNRMMSGGFVLSGRSVTLADITCPILAFLGLHDDMARPAAVRAITRAAPDAEVSFVGVEAGHFGIVVGSRARAVTWPTVASWVHYREGTGPLPPALAKQTPTPRRPTSEDEPEGAGFDVDVDLDLFVDTIADSARAAWRRAGDVVASATDALATVRYREPRLRQLAEMTPQTRTSPSRWLADRAASDPEATFFLWQGRAFTYRDADTRVGYVVRGLYASGVRPGEKVGVVMGSRPSFLSASTALIRMGAVPVIAPPSATPEAIRAAFAEAGVAHVLADPEHAAACVGLGPRGVLVLGDGGKQRNPIAGTTDMEAIDPNAVVLPADVALDAGLARDLSVILLRPAESGELRPAPVTNHRWALSALGAAAACTLTDDDTVYCAIPLHHPAGLLVGVGAALAAGTRLALGERFSGDTFWTEARRYGATVAFYAGEMLRPLLEARPGKGDHTHPLRLVAGSGMRKDLWRKLIDRFGVGVMEFYASTTHKVIMANASGEKIGALGRMLPGSAETVVVACDPSTWALARTDKGRLVRAAVDEPGLLAARLEPDDDVPRGTIVEGAFAAGDRYYVSGDVVRRDAHGDTWFIDSVSGFARLAEGPVSTRAVEDALYTLPEVELCAAWAEAGGVAVAFTAREVVPEDRIRSAFAALAEHARPKRAVQLDEIPLTDGFRPDKARVRALAAEHDRDVIASE